jgi:hypothetical protein
LAQRDGKPSIYNFDKPIPNVDAKILNHITVIYLFINSIPISIYRSSCNVFGSMQQTACHM